MNPNIAEEYVKQIMDDFGLYEYPKIIYDNSLHYKCYLDDGWRAERIQMYFCDKQKKSHTIYK